MTTPSKVMIKDSPIHGKGMFATSDIANQERVIEYVGDILSNNEGDERAIITEKNADHKFKGAVYLFEINEDFVLDGNVDWNPARFINHSCNPNCETGFEGERIFIFAIKDINKDEELSYDYSYEITNDYKDHPCFCQSENCVGYILNDEEKEKLRNKENI
ncbi:MAG: SET domain-containing protein-lysine N-methyltransferase [Planctomycetota bacterium]|nr:MAG: SET domain-containing protein-lysine N-methyltransferase [Planctomycetota bacterium]